MTIQDIFRTREDAEGEHWISVSDLMSGLMIIFLFIAISYMRDITGVAISWAYAKDDLYNELYEEFQEDLVRWNAEIDRATLSVKFKSPDVLFDLGKDTLKPRFKEILNDFFPRYLKILFKSKYKSIIEEVRIEGHTSSGWSKSVKGDEAYFRNMKLSQDRTRSVLEYSFLLPAVVIYKDWSRKKITANGLSSSKLVMINGREDPQHSRRVEFKIRTNAESQINRILEKSGREGL